MPVDAYAFTGRQDRHNEGHQDTTKEPDVLLQKNHNVYAGHENVPLTLARRSAKSAEDHNVGAATPSPSTDFNSNR